MKSNSSALSSSGPTRRSAFTTAGLGLAAIAGIGGRAFLDPVQNFEVIETLAKGPMVINERHDHFTGGPLKMWHGVSVFFLKEGKVVDWYDCTISMDRA